MLDEPKNQFSLTCAAPRPGGREKVIPHPFDLSATTRVKE